MVETQLCKLRGTSDTLARWACFCGEIMTQRPATAGPAATAAAAAAVHKACYNQLSTTLQRYRAQQQQATPCACDRSALYCCVELLWEAPEIHHPSHLLVPGGMSRLLLSLFCFIRHNTQVHVTAHNYSASSSRQCHALKDKISSAVSLCLFRYALPLAAFVVDAALLVGSLIFLYHTYVRVHMQRS